jgi:hypothetical protein
MDELHGFKWRIGGIPAVDHVAFQVAQVDNFRARVLDFLSSWRSDMT